MFVTVQKKQKKGVDHPVAPVQQDPLRDSVNSDPLTTSGLPQQSQQPVQKKSLGHKISSWFGEKTGIKTGAFKEDTREKARTSLETMDLGTAMTTYRDAFMKFCQQEFSTENLLFVEWVDAGADKKTAYNRFIRVGSAREINIGGTVRAALDDLAHKEHYEAMDFGAARKDAIANLSDTWSRARFSGVMVDAVTKKMGG